MTDMRMPEAEYWQKAFEAYEKANGVPARNAWEVTCYFAARQSMPSLGDTLFGKGFL